MFREKENFLDKILVKKLTDEEKRRAYKLREKEKVTIEDVDSTGLEGRCSSPNRFQFGVSFSASAKTFFSNSKSNWKLLRGISPICGDN